MSSAFQMLRLGPRGDVTASGWFGRDAQSRPKRILKFKSFEAQAHRQQRRHRPCDECPGQGIADRSPCGEGCQLVVDPAAVHGRVQFVTDHESNCLKV